MSKDVPEFKNLIFDQLVTNKGKLSYCVRWDNEKSLTKATASKFQAVLEKQINVWNRWLAGYECWPYNHIVGYAVKDKSIMGWSDDSLDTIYEGILDGEGSPKCPDECYKHQGQAASADTSGCKGKPFDLTLLNHFLEYLDKEEQMTLLHEMGHGFGLPEMYVAENKPSGYPTCVMDEDEMLTDGDGWLVRSILENIKSRYDF
ncbi:hypothetical protein PI124_g3715 [Phytophthora idaei]|nr:hypothetical protein PI125_g3159 [Phytophthora idaei]KAG3171538.1 hypothetical protein PI126_g1837 [Phytophthora idaei]KAG3251677.1 hypothetical protein PI124_g3715 [Phytophthora idaei]